MQEWRFGWLVEEGEYLVLFVSLRLDLLLLNLTSFHIYQIFFRQCLARDWVGRILLCDISFKSLDSNRQLTNVSLNKGLFVDCPRCS